MCSTLSIIQADKKLFLLTIELEIQREGKTTFPFFFLKSTSTKIGNLNFSILIVYCQPIRAYPQIIQTLLQSGTLDNETYEDRWSIQIVGILTRYPGQNFCYLYMYTYIYIFVTVYILSLIIIICNILLVFIIYRPNKYVYVLSAGWSDSLHNLLTPSLTFSPLSAYPSSF